MKRKMALLVAGACCISTMLATTQAHAVTILGQQFSDTEKFSASRLTVGGWDPHFWTAGNGFMTPDDSLGVTSESFSGADFTITSIYFEKVDWKDWKKADSAIGGGNLVVRGVYNGQEQVLVSGVFSSGTINQDTKNDHDNIQNPTAANNNGYINLAALINVNGGALAGFFDGNLLGLTGLFYKSTDKAGDIVAYGQADFYARAGVTPPNNNGGNNGSNNGQTEVPEPASMALLMAGLGGMAAKRRAKAQQ